MMDERTKYKITILLALILTIPWLFSRLLNIYMLPYHKAILSGIAIVCSATILSWACEAAEVDVPRSFAIAIAALLAVLPEYAIDGYLAWMAGKDPAYLHYAIANMTGANRLLIGIGWSLVALYAILRNGTKTGLYTIKLDDSLRLEIFFLMISTMYAFLLPFKGNISVFDTAFFITVFIMYLYLSMKSPYREFEICGIAGYICSFPKGIRRLIIISLYLYSGMIIMISVDAFADGLIKTGEIFKIDPFLMIQWIAPVASESPELTVALLFVKRLKTSAGINTLISSKINQWTLLIGSLSIIYSLSYGSLSNLPLDLKQQREVFLTASQSIFATAVILNLRFSIVEAIILTTLFLIQLIIPETRIIVSIAYIMLCIPVFLKEKRHIFPMLKYVKSLAR